MKVRGLGLYSTSRRGTMGKSRLLHHSQATQKHDGGLNTKNDDQGHQRANDTGDGLGDAIITARR